MIVAIGSNQRNHLTDHLLESLKDRRNEVTVHRTVSEGASGWLYARFAGEVDGSEREYIRRLNAIEMARATG